MEPFRIRVPSDADRAPLVYDSPHSGRFYPPDFATNAARLDLRRGEDAYVDDLLAAAPALGAWVLDATYPRCYVDLNRELTDIDAELLAEPWPTPLTPTEKSARGLGLIRRYVVPGIEVNARRLSASEVQARIDGVYRPYHAALESLIETAHHLFGMVWHVNWHSMKSMGNSMTPDGPILRRADFVVSNLEGQSASPAMTGLLVDALGGLGYRVALNDPYKGGTIVRRIGSPQRRIHSVQIEINRSLYLDERTVEKTEGFDRLARDLETLTRELATAARDEAA